MFAKTSKFKKITDGSENVAHWRKAGENSVESGRVFPFSAQDFLRDLSSHAAIQSTSVAE